MKSFRVTRFQDSKMSRFQDFKKMKSWNFEILNAQDFKFSRLKINISQVLKSWTLKISRSQYFQNLEVLKSWTPNFQVFWGISKKWVWWLHLNGFGPYLLSLFLLNKCNSWQKLFLESLKLRMQLFLIELLEVIPLWLVLHTVSLDIEAKTAPWSHARCFG